MLEQLIKITSMVCDDGTAKFREEPFDIKSKTKINYQIYAHVAVPDSLGGVQHGATEATQRIAIDGIGKVKSEFRNDIGPNRNYIRFHTYTLNRKEDIDKAKLTLYAHIQDHLEECQYAINRLLDAAKFL